MHPFRYSEMRPIFYITKSICLVSFLLLAHQLIAQENSETDKLITKKWYISTNFTSLFRDKRLLLVDQSQFPTTNRYISIEPEMDLTKNVTVRFPIQLGFNFLRKEFSTEAQSNSYYFYLLNDGFYNTANQPYFSSEYTQHSYTVQKGEKPTNKSVHKQDIIFQIGINPKMYMTEQRKVSVYFSPSFSLGLMDSYALDYYHSFKNNSTDTNSIYWVWDKEIINYHHNPFIFLRLQTCFGLEIKLSTNFSLGIETGLSTYVDSEGKKDDRVFISLDGGDFKQIYTDFNPNQMNKLLPVHFTNRVLLRYSIN